MYCISLTYGHKTRLIWLLVSVLGVMALQGCGSTSLFDAQSQLRQSFLSGNLDRSQDLMERFARNNIYRTNDRVLMQLELGALHYYSGNYEQSMHYFQEAELEIDRLFGVSVERNIRALLLNDGQLEYQGEDYEDYMLNLFNALSAVHLNDLEAALVETRRATFKLESLAIRYDGIVETLSRTDTTKVDTRPPWERGRTNIQESPFGHYLSYVIYANQGRTDNARIEYERFRRAYGRAFLHRIRNESQLAPVTSVNAASAAGTSVNAVSEEVARRSAASGSMLPYPEPGNVLLLGFGGRAPEKKSNELRIYSNDLSTYIKYAVPSLRQHRSRIRSVEAVINDTLTVQMPMLDDFALIAEDVFNVRKPLIVTRAIIRSTLKYIGSQATQRAIRDEYGADAGRLAGLITGIFTEVSEEADLRAWQTMPGQVYGQTVSLPEGTHHVRIRYLGNNRMLLHETEQNVESVSERPLQIREAFYWN